MVDEPKAETITLEEVEQAISHMASFYHVRGYEAPGIGVMVRLRDQLRRGDVLISREQAEKALETQAEATRLQSSFGHERRAIGDEKAAEARRLLHLPSEDR